ncbi:MAG: DUF2220 family protein [Pseudomonadota bacterium]|nr:DUF2220 family protein [Pseudomonadota bacterium]
MNSWSTIADIRQQMEKTWKQGRFLVPNSPNCNDLFPFSVKLKHPTSSEMDKDFSSCQQWIKQFKDTALYKITWKDINHHRFGKNQLPVEIVFESMQAVLVYLDKQDEHQKYHQLSTHLMSVFSILGGWLNRYPFKVLAHSDVWDSLIAVSQWMMAHPQPDIYIRQIPITGIDSKLIEQHKKLLSEWWENLLDEEDIDCQAIGIKQFEQRYGFKSKPHLLRFRILDPELHICGLSDLTITVEEFSKLELDVETVFVTENDINSLAFPDFSKAIVLFGRGYGFEYLQKIQWLEELNIYYWGDIDTHGFNILNQFRQYLPKTKSFLMDEKTLMEHRKKWVYEQKPTMVDLPHLNHKELKLYNKLRDNQIGENVRLEQEFVHYLSLKKSLIEMKPFNR